MVSSDVLKLFMRRNLTWAPVEWRRKVIWSTMMSKNVLWFLTGRRLFAFWRPMLVPSPPFSLMTTVWLRRWGSKLA